MSKVAEAEAESDSVQCHNLAYLLLRNNFMAPFSAE